MTVRGLVNNVLIGGNLCFKSKGILLRREYETHETQVGCVELEKIETVQDAIDSILAE